MANQIVLLSQGVFDSLHHFAKYASKHTGHRLMFEPVGSDPRTQAISVLTDDSRLALDWIEPSYWGSPVLLLVTTPEAGRLHQLLPLPDDLALDYLDLLIPILAGQLDLSGHDCLELIGAVNDARKTPNWIPIRPQHRRPASVYERRLASSAEGAQQRHGSTLATFDLDYRAHRDAALRTGMTPIIRHLGTQGPVADALHLTPGTEPHCFVMADDRDLMTYHLQHRRAHAARIALDGMFYTVKMHALEAAALSRGWISSLHKRADFRTFAEQDRFKWRDLDVLPDADRPSEVPAEEIWDTLSAFCTAFDTRLLSRYHPVIRAALAYYEFMRIQPCPSENDRVGKLFFANFLDAMGLWALPTPLVLHRQRYALENILDGTLQMGDPEILIDFTIELCRQALTAGQRISEQAGAECTRLRDALMEQGFGAARADMSARQFLAHVTVSLNDDRSYLGAELQQVATHLHRLGLVDQVTFGDRTCWSSPIPRKLASSWTRW